MKWVTKGNLESGPKVLLKFKLKGQNMNLDLSKSRDTNTSGYKLNVLELKQNDTILVKALNYG